MLPYKSLLVVSAVFSQYFKILNVNHDSDSNRYFSFKKTIKKHKK